MMNPMLMDAAKKTAEQLQADMLAAQEKLKAKMQSDLDDMDKLEREGWLTIPVPVGEQEIDEIFELSDGREETRTVTRPRYVNAYCRNKVKGDPSTMEFRMPLHPEIAAQYEVRNIPALNLIRKEQPSRNLDEVFAYIDQYAKCKYEEGVAIAKGYHADAHTSAGQAEMVMADIRYIISGDVGE
jgi:hypothetical protein